MDHRCHAGGGDLWSTLWYLQVQDDFTPEGNTVVFPARPEVQSEVLILRRLQASGAIELHAGQWSLLLVKDHQDFVHRSSLLDRTLQSVPLPLQHGTRVTNKTDGHLTGRLCGDKQVGMSLTSALRSKVIQQWTSLLTVDGGVQLGATLVVLLMLVVVEAQGRRVPFGHLLDRPGHGGGALVPAVLPDGLLHVELGAQAGALAHGAGGGQRVAELHHHLGGREYGFVWTSCVCRAERNRKPESEIKTHTLSS